jgi:hypothetical protein
MYRHFDTQRYILGDKVLRDYAEIFGCLTAWVKLFDIPKLPTASAIT